MQTTEFLTRVKQAAQLPDNDEDFPDSEILLEATQALYERFAQPISALRNGYWLHRSTVPTVSGQNRYRIPPRGIVQGLEKFEISADSGTNWKQLSILTDSSASDFHNNTSNIPNWFSLEGDTVVLYPTPPSGMTLKWSYYLRPSKLISVNALGTVVSSPAANTIRVSGADPTSFLGSLVDVVNTTGCNEACILDAPVVSVTSAGGNWDIVVNSTVDLSLLAAGQVVRPADQTDYIPLPMELHSALVARTAAVILVAKGDAEKASQYDAKAEGAIKRIVDAATPRVKARPYEFRTRNTYLRRRIGLGFGWR